MEKKRETFLYLPVASTLDENVAQEQPVITRIVRRWSKEAASKKGGRRKVGCEGSAWQTA